MPVPSDEPPVGTEYQLMVPAEDVAPSVTVPASHLEDGVVPVIVGVFVIVAVTPVLAPVVQPFRVAST